MCRNVWDMANPTDTQPAATGWIAEADPFGARLVLVRQRMGWSNVTEAARQCGLHAESWRLWEQGRMPSRLTTVALTIASRTGCDYLWLVHGPNRGGATLSSIESGARIVAVGGARHATRSDDVVHTRPVRQTKPAGGVARRPLTAMAL